MAHKTLIGGTAYEISGGKTLVNGTAYSIKNGKTLVDGTAYEVGFRPAVATITITGSGGEYAYATIGGVSYKTATTIEVPFGTSIDLTFNKYSDSPDPAFLTIYRSDGTVREFENYGTQRTVVYTVIGDCTIKLELKEMNSPFGLWCSGRIKLYES